MAEKKLSTAQQQGRIYPNSLEAEQALLCCVLIDGGVSHEIVPKLTHDHFYQEWHKQIFDAMAKLYLEQKPIDVITVTDMREEKADREEFFNYVVSLTSVVPSASNVDDYFKVLERDMLRRKVITACDRVIALAYETTDTKEIMLAAEKLIFDLVSDGRKTGGELTHICNPMNEYITVLEKMAKDKSANRGLLTGYKLFDYTTNGLKPGQMIVLAARPGVGKTSFALNIATNVVRSAKEKAVIAIFSLEMAQQELTQRIISGMGGIPASNLSSGNNLSTEFEKIFNVRNELVASKLYMCDNPFVTPADIMSQCRRLSIKEGKIDLIIIDYLQLMKAKKDTDRGRDIESRQQEVTELSRRLKILAKELKCPVLVLSQLSRLSVQQDRPPMLSDLRESGAIEQDADIVLLMSQENENVSKDETNFNVLMEMAKHRAGEKKTIRLAWEGQYTRFTEHSDPIANMDYIREVKAAKAAKAYKKGE